MIGKIRCQHMGLARLTHVFGPVVTRDTQPSPIQVHPIVSERRPNEIDGFNFVGGWWFDESRLNRH